MNSRRIELDTPAGKILFRLATYKDVRTIRGENPTLPIEEIAGADTPIEKKIEAGLQFADKLLMRCALRPRLVAQEDLDLDDEGQLCIDELPDETKLDIQNRLLNVAGFTKEAADDLRPTSETAQVS